MAGLRYQVLGVMFALLFAGLAVAKPIVKLRSKKYKTILSLDGGVFRGLMQTQVLVALENAIKKRIVEKYPKKYNSTAAFDILLSDYFDLVAGTSIGGYLTAYLTTNGGDIASKFPAQFTSLPGSAAGAAQLFDIFAVTLAGVKMNKTYSNDAVQLGYAVNATLSKMFGTRSMHSYSSYNTSGLWTWTHMDNSNMAYLFVDPTNKTGGYVLPGNSNNEPDQVWTGRNFYLWQACRGSGTYVPLIAPFNVSTTPDTPAADKANFIIADGAFGAENPAVLAIPYALSYKKWPLKKLAVLSLGTTSYGNYTTYNNWIDNIPKDYNLGWDLGGTANKFSATALLRAMFGVASGQPGPFLRIDREFDRDKPCTPGNVTAATCDAWKTAVIQSLPGPDKDNANFKSFREIGQSMAAEYASQIQTFVNTYLV